MKIKEEVFITNSFEETHNLGKEFVASVTRSLLDEGDSLLNVVALYGELGGGKTTFVQGMAKGFGITRRIISPTFIIVRSYKISIKYKVLSIKYFYHIDVYRVNSRSDIVDLGIEEVVDNPQNIVAIEWAEKMDNLLPKKRWNVGFEHLGEDKRRITIENGKN